MNIKRNSEVVFSTATFEILDEWGLQYYRYDTDIYEFSKKNRFIDYVEKPFIRFCQKVSAKLSLPVTAQINNKASNINGQSTEEIIIDESECEYDYNRDCYDYKQLALHICLCNNPLLCIRITSLGIKLVCCEESHELMIKNLANKNPQVMGEIIAEQPFILNLEKYLYIEKSTLLYNWGFEHSVDQVVAWFQQYIPLVLLVTYDEPMLPIRQYLNYRKEPDLRTWTEKTGFDETELERWVSAINRKK